MRPTVLEVSIQSLAVGAAFGVTEYLSDGIAIAILMGVVVAFLISFAVFDLVMRR